METRVTVKHLRIARILALRAIAAHADDTRLHVRRLCQLSERYLWENADRVIPTDKASRLPK